MKRTRSRILATKVIAALAEQAIDVQCRIRQLERPRIMLTSWVRWRTRRSRVRCSASAACCSTDLIGTKRMVGQVTGLRIPGISLESRTIVWGAGVRTFGPDDGSTPNVFVIGDIADVPERTGPHFPDRRRSRG